MTNWKTFSEEAPELAGAVRDRLEASKHHVLATLRGDGAPRASATEVVFQGDDLMLGSMWGAAKAQDLQRDARFALHANPGDGSMDGGDAKLEGAAVEIVEPERTPGLDEHADPPPPYHLFRLDLDKAVLTSLHPDGDRLVIETWRPGRPVRRIERR